MRPATAFIHVSRPCCAVDCGQKGRGRGREGEVGSSGLGDECSTDSVLTVAEADGPSHLVQVSHSEFLQAMDTHVVLDRAECPMVSECSPNVNIYMYSVSDRVPSSKYTVWVSTQ